ncbi:hypothetical protein [Schleiferilactobacillus perolens]|uniref:hypothetical protein n=1 Tax=Schleiferilactobacillus perolens TaxID=100468 RepID=UPI002356DED5|nr:hypothetical protein [Schleiferilactobacillus perolens]MCI2170839.1 hypothetical protein [Schleiferilactobacillus perolens]
MPPDIRISFFFGWPHITLFQQLVEIGIIAGQGLTIGEAMRDLTNLYPMIVVRSSRRQFAHISYRELLQIWVTFSVLTCFISMFWVGFQPIWWIGYFGLLGVAMLVFTQPHLDWAALEFCLVFCIMRVGVQYLVIGW